MIISASRRTDIPAFYSNWLMRRLQDGFVLVRNPMNSNQVSRVALTPEHIECLVFWTKNPAPMLARLTEIDDLGYHYYFLFTLTPYDGSLEPNVPPLHARIATFHALAERIGRAKVLWRYDPIIFTNRYTADLHAAAFTEIAGGLAGYTDRCIVSFLEMYKKCRKNMKSLTLSTPPVQEQAKLLSALHEIGGTHGITLQTCAGGKYPTNTEITPGKCIDDSLVSLITNTAVHATKDKNQRRECRCIESIDIGAYNSCPHNCLYCYANSDGKSVVKNFAAHDPDSPLLYGSLQDSDRVGERLLKSLIIKQLPLF
jgi:hypothetical protein